MPKRNWIDLPAAGVWKLCPAALWRIMFALLLLCAPQAAGADMIAEGRTIVAEHCTRCHVVPGINPKGGIESTPSFRAVSYTHLTLPTN